MRKRSRALSVRILWRLRYGIMPRCKVIGESPSTTSHKAEAKRACNIGIIVISTSVSQGTKEDRSGGIIRDRALAAGHAVVRRQIVPDEPDAIRSAVMNFAEDPGIDAIISTGGTGLTPTDVTIETVRPLFRKELTGFTPLFMQLSYEDVGPACMLSRATAGIFDSAVLFALPGSPKACELAMDKLILPEVTHIVKHFGD